MASTYLERTVSPASNRRTWTWSAWVKLGALSGNQSLFTSRSSGSDYATIRIEPDRFHIFDISTSFVYQVKTNRRLRDPNAWYHLVVAFDTTQATASNRIKMYVNGQQETSLAESSYPSENYQGFFNNNLTHYIGQGGNLGDRFDGSMSHINFVDGTALTPSSFGETDATTGIWKPITAPSVTYGTNGFFLKFENSGSMGTDSSGNANNFTVNGTMTQTIDTPSNVFTCWNAIQSRSSDFTFANGNSTFSLGGISRGGISTLGASAGKYYYEAKCSSGTFFQLGAVKSSYAWNNDDVWSGKTGAIVYKENGNIYKDGSSVSSAFSTISSGDIVMVAIDLDNNYMYFGKNGTWGNSGDPTSGATGTGGISISADEYLFAVSGASNTIQGNFGNGYFGTTAVSSAQNPDDGIGIFEYDVPAGYRALCTKSINAEEYS